jgi:hypothetical protein
VQKLVWDNEQVNGGVTDLDIFVLYFGLDIGNFLRLCVIVYPFVISTNPSSPSKCRVRGK